MNDVEAVGYVRLSQDSNRSIQDQKADIDAYCASSNRLKLQKIVNEGERQSGFDPERGKYLELKKMIESSEIDAVVVRGTERLGRDFDERQLFIVHCRRNGVELHCTERGRIEIEDETVAGVEGIHAAQDDKAKRKEIERAKKAIAEKQEAGEYHGRPLRGTRYTGDKSGLEAGEGFNDVLRVLELKDEGATHREVVDAISSVSSTSVVTRIIRRREVYESIEESGRWMPALELSKDN